MLEFSEIRHLEGMKGNFEVADEKEYVTVATLHKAQPIPQLIFSNVPKIVEHNSSFLIVSGIRAYLHNKG